MRARIPFRSPVSADDFSAFANHQGWRLDGSVPAGSEAAEELVWEAADDLFVHWINDPILHRVYGMIVGPEVSPLETLVRRFYDAYSVEEAVAEFAAASDWPERVETLSVVAAAAPQNFDQRVFTALSSALADAHTVVRRKAALVAFYARWSELLPSLRAMANGDPDDEARRVAAIAIETIENPELEPYPA